MKHTYMVAHQPILLGTPFSRWYPGHLGTNVRRAAGVLRCGAVPRPVPNRRGAGLHSNFRGGEAPMERVERGTSGRDT